MRLDLWEKIRRGREVPDFWRVDSTGQQSVWLWRMEGTHFRVIVAGDYPAFLSHADYLLIHQRYLFLFRELRNGLHARSARISDFVLGTERLDFVELCFDRVYSLDSSFDLPTDGVQAWNIEGALFVSPSLKELMEGLGEAELEFSPGFSRLA